MRVATVASAVDISAMAGALARDFTADLAGFFWSLVLGGMATPKR